VLLSTANIAIVLFFSNIAYTIITSFYIKNLYTDIVKVRKFEVAAKEKKRDHKLTLEDQLSYINNNQEAERIQFNIFPWKILSFIVVITQAILINMTEPVIMFGFRLNILTGIISVGLMAFCIIWGLNKLGLKM